MFFGIIIQMLSFDNKEHHIAHIHARYGEFLATFKQLAIEGGEIFKIDPLK
jgi:hypothetical protein